MGHVMHSSSPAGAQHSRSPVTAKLRAEGARSTVPYCSVHQQFTNVRRPISARQSSFPSTLPIQVTILGARASQADHIVVLFRYLSARWGPFPFVRPKARTQRRQKPRSLRRCPRQLRRARTSALSLPLPINAPEHGLSSRGAGPCSWLRALGPTRQGGTGSETGGSERGGLQNVLRERAQHPPSDAPAISAMWADPPSVAGTGGGQVVPEARPDAAAVVVAACDDEVSGVSPGNCKGTCERLVDDALMPDVLPSVAVPAGEPVDPAGPKDSERVGKVDVGTLSGSEPKLPSVMEPKPLPLVPSWTFPADWLFAWGAVWALTPVNPRTMAAISNAFRIALLPPAFIGEDVVGQRANRENGDEICESLKGTAGANGKSTSAH